MTSSPCRVLLTGLPGCGKTTVLLRTLERLHRPSAGFYTEEVRRRGASAQAGRLGFDVVSLDGRRGVLARKGGPGPRVGRYGVDVRSFEDVGVRALEAGLRDEGTLLVIDEIGKMELLSRAFVELLARVFSAPNPLLGTILSKAHAVADHYRHVPGVELIAVTRDSREELPERLAQRFGRP